MPRFCANLNSRFTELPLLDRFEAAAKAGFKGVEIGNPYEAAINVSDLQAAREKIFADRVEYIFKHMDKKKTGKISKDEALGEVKIHFDEIDANKDGFIDREELLKAIAAKPKPEKEEK